MILLTLAGCFNPSDTQIKGETQPDTSATDKKADEIKTVQKPRTQIPETNFDSCIANMVISAKDIAPIEKWVRKVAMGSDDEIPIDKTYMTKTCSTYVNDASEAGSGYDEMMDERTFRKKWASKYDVKKASFVHLFQTGNGGWASKKIKELKYLGELNEGDWFQLTILGSSLENDYSEKIIRVVKVIKKGDKFLIDNFLSLSDQ